MTSSDLPPLSDTIADYANSPYDVNFLFIIIIIINVFVLIYFDLALDSRVDYQPIVNHHLQLTIITMKVLKNCFVLKNVVNVIYIYIYFYI